MPLYITKNRYLNFAGETESEPGMRAARLAVFKKGYGMMAG